ncbi:MAG: ABC transporter ATP-binding protein [Chloroflexi bacterium RBG_16_56_8]|nr:MAG: ABC transporter ATP-binding protein [Chloroflexi bacterium RBG_16_56_8]
MLEVRNISKSFPGVKALDHVNLQVRKNEIVGLVGENGAGKSTLLKILIGAYQADEGELLVGGESVRPRSVKEASDYGLAMVFQEQSLLSNLAVRENIFLGNEEPFLRFGVINWKKMDQAARVQLKKVELDLDPATYTDTLNFATRQMVELARVMTLEDRTSRHPIIILDEPTTVLENNEVKLLFERLRSLKERASIIFVSHHLDEILEISDRVYIFKDGKNIAERKTRETHVGELHRLMVGRELKGEYYRESKQATPGDDVVLSIQHLTKKGAYHDVTFDLRRGEIIGLAGVLGSGREEVCRTVAGIVVPDSGQVCLGDFQLPFGRPAAAIKAGIGYVPQDRGSEGLITYLSIGPNITLPSLGQVVRRGFLDLRHEKNMTVEWINRLGIKTPGPDALCLNLSGGNQQKVVLAKWLASQVKIFVLDHPTRGVDVGAKEDVYELVRALAQQGIAMLLISDTLDETIGLSNAILTMKDGRITQRIAAPIGKKPQPVDLIQHMM